MPSSIRVLLIEDSDDDAYLLGRELKRAGFNAEIRREDTLGGLRDALRAGPWDIVISDYALPDFDGLATIRTVQEEGVDLPLIIVSGTIGEDVAVEAMRAGANDYVMKDRLARLGPAVERELREVAERRARRRAEEAYRSLVEGSLQGFLIIQDGRVVFANEAVGEIFGYTAKELESLPGDRVEAAVHPEDREVVWERYRRRMAGEEVSSRYQIRVWRKDGVMRWVDLQASPVDFAGKPAIQAAIVDVTERLRHDREQKAIATVATSLRAAENRSELVGLLLSQVMQLLDAEGVALATRDEGSGEVHFEMALGAWTDVVGGQIPAGQGLSGMIIRSRQPYLNNAVNSDPRLVYTEILAQTRAVAGVPLIAADESIGVLWMGRGTDIAQDDLLLLTAIAEMTASALRRIVLHEELERSNEELIMAYDSTLEGWARALELRDADTEGHTRRVVELAETLGIAMGLDGEELDHLRRGALLHDIGKMAIPDTILRKPGALDDHEWQIMKQHPKHAHDMLSRISYLQPALEIPYCHHERWDGTGYPRGLRGEEIPIAARIFAVVDVWDAVRSDRPYRKAWSRPKAVAHIQEGSGSHFDPSVVAVFLSLIGDDERYHPSLGLGGA